MTPRRGEVWWCEPPHIGRRPVVVLSRDAAIPRLGRAVVPLHNHDWRARVRSHAGARRRSDWQTEGCEHRLDRECLGRCTDRAHRSPRHRTHEPDLLCDCHRSRLRLIERHRHSAEPKYSTPVRVVWREIIARARSRRSSPRRVRHEHRQALLCRSQRRLRCRCRTAPTSEAVLEFGQLDAAPARFRTRLEAARLTCARLDATTRAQKIDQFVAMFDAGETVH